MAQQRFRFGPATVYASGMLQGLAMVAFPASAAVLKGPTGLTDTEYGAIFLPQVALAVVGSIAGASLARRLGLRKLLSAAMLANVGSMIALAAGVGMTGHVSFDLLMLATGLLGLGFGLGGAPLNTFPGLLFPGRRDTALVALHSLLGMGLAAGPLILAPFLAADSWIGFPVLVAGLCGLTFVGTILVALPEPVEAGERRATGTPARQGLFWVFATIAVLYAFAEGTFSNWATVYMNEGLGASEAGAGLALTVFWAAMVIGRILTSWLVLQIAPQRIWVILPGLMIGTFLLLPLAASTASGIALFGLAGLACSSFFPLTITMTSRAFEEHIAWVSSMMIAALMVGVGAGTFVFGPLREWLSFADLYRVSAIYPLIVLVLTVAVVIRRGRAAGSRLQE